MAHNLNKVGNKVSMMYYGEPAWHGLGQGLDHAATAEEAIQQAHLDYTVEKFPLLATTNGRAPMVRIPNQFATMRTDTWDVLGVVGDRYEVVQNKDAFAFFDQLVGEGEAIYHTAGALGLGERIWILAKMPDYIVIKGANGKEDAVEKYLLLTTGHDGQNQIKAKLTPVRVVCNNTLSMALRGTEQEVTIIHSANVRDRLAEAHRILGLTNKLYSQVQAVFEKMSLKEVTNDQLLAYVNKLLPDNPDAENNTRRTNQREQILDLAENGLGAELARGTVWGAYNAVTEYADHVATMNKTADQRLQYAWFGGGQDLKDDAFKLATTMLN